MGWRAFVTEWKARRAGRRALSSNLSKSAREVVGPTGAMFSRGWDAMATGSEAYVRSFDPRVPRSIFVSQNDRSRVSIPIPLVERCIEDHVPRRTDLPPATGDGADEPE